MCIVCSGAVCGGSGACVQASRSLAHYIYMIIAGGSSYLLYTLRNHMRTFIAKGKIILSESMKDHPYTKAYRALFK